MATLTVSKAKSLRGRVRVPGDKSISHRAVMLGSIASGTTEVRGFLWGADCLSTVRCFRALGVNIIEDQAAGTVTIEGRGLRGLAEPDDVLDVGNSGTTMRLILGILAGQPFFSSLTGDASIRRRPMGRVVEPLRLMGARIWGRRGAELAPLCVTGGELYGIEYDLPVASAQVKSAILLAGLYAEEETILREPAPTRDHTERMLAAFGAGISADRAARTATVQGGAELAGQRVVVPGDLSSAAFFIAAAASLPGSEVRVEGVGLNPTRTGLLDALRAMGADIEVVASGEDGPEPVGDLVVRGSELRGITVGGDLVPRLIDEVPALAVAALAAEGETEIRDASELKVKESNRLEALAAELGRLGADIEELRDGLRIRGRRRLLGTMCSSRGDHRIAMALGMAGLLADGTTVVDDSDCIAVSYPGFERDLRALIDS